jgi:hypothetical protein
MAVANDEPDWLLDEMDKVAKPAKKAKKAAPGGGGGGCGGCCTGRLCCAVTGLLLLLLAAGTLAASLLVRDMYPEFASWSDKLCPHSDMWVDSKGRERVLKHYPSLDNPLFHAAEAAAYRYRDTLGPGPLQLQTDLLVLVATHHKTGTVLARKLFNSMCLRLRQCCTVHVTAATEADVRRSVAEQGVRLVSHSQVGRLSVSQSVSPSVSQSVRPSVRQSRVRFGRRKEGRPSD